MTNRDPKSTLAVRYDEPQIGRDRRLHTDWYSEPSRWRKIDDNDPAADSFADMLRKLNSAGVTA